MARRKKVNEPITADSPILSISQAAQMAGMHPQTLRQYDRLGLVTPTRTLGGGRRYSHRDVNRLKQVQHLSQEKGINLAGIEMILALQDQVRYLRNALTISGEELRSRVFSAGAATDDDIVVTYVEQSSHADAHTASSREIALRNSTQIVLRKAR